MFLRQRSLFPQEKTYLHMDRNHYIPGDTVWFCGYGVDASTLICDTLSRYLYVDLQSPDGTLSQQVKVINRNGVFPGYLALPDNLPAGNYTVSAYTLFMTGMDESYFFRRPLAVSSPSSTLITPDISFEHNSSGNRLTAQLRFTGRASRSVVSPGKLLLALNAETPSEYRPNPEKLYKASFRSLDPQARNVLLIDYDKSKSYVEIPPQPELFDVSFFPEGGYLLADQMSAVGVKALKANGLGEEITGTLFDSSGNEVTTFGTVYKGMGTFSFTPETGKGYYALCKNTQGHTKRFDFPEPLTDAVALRAGRRGERLYITVGSGSEVILPNNLTLVMQSQGVVRYAQKLGASKTVIFDAGQLPSGVLHFLLLNGDQHILSERLVFSLNKLEQPQVTLTVNKPIYSRREKVQSSVTVLDTDGNPLAGQFSVSVTDDRDVLPDSTYNILTELLLSSELKGYVEAPGWYFVGSEPVRQYALDALMLTQGWRRYDVRKVFQGDFQQVEAPLEMGMELSGRVKSLVSSKGSAGTPVYMVAPSTSRFWKTETDGQGRFYFSDFDFPDSLTFVVRALSRRNNDNVELIVNKENTAEIPHPAIPHPYLHSLLGSASDTPNTLRDSLFTAKANRKWTIENGMRTIHLDEVMVRGTSRPALPTAYFSGRGITYDQEYIKKHQIKNLEHFFAVAPHVRIGSPSDVLGEAGAIYVQGLDGSYSKTTVYIDNSMIPDEGFLIWDISLDMVEGIEVTRVRSPGLNSVRHSVRIWLKKDWTPQVEDGWNQQTITLKGYQPPMEFYSPKYEKLTEHNQEIPDLRTTIYWNPALQTDKRGATTFEFYTSDAPQTTYSVIIEGITADGRIIRNIKRISCQ